MLWASWAMCLALLAIELAAPTLLALRPEPWDAAQTAVAGFVLAIFAVTAGVWTFALRESFVLSDIRRGVLDPSTSAGFARVRRLLFALWGLCLLIGLFGAGLAWAAARPRAAWPYVGGAAALLVVHAPRHWLFNGTRP